MFRFIYLGNYLILIFLQTIMAENIWFFSLFFVTPKCCTSRTFSWEHSENIFRFFPFFSLFSPFFPFFFENNWEQLRTISWEQLRTKTLLFGVKMFSDSLRFYQENSFGKVMIRGIRSRNFVWNFQVIDTGDWLIHLVSCDSRSPEKK